ncbi:MAG: hypothetical protein WC091_07040 [Sulfuricellaceae bacterium]
MTWESALDQLNQTELVQTELVEFGIHQMDTKVGSPKWRRHKGNVNFRFRSVRAALFSPDKGARAACLGYSSYANSRYSAGTHSIVPYVAVWSRGADDAFLIRASAGHPEIVIVDAANVASIRDCPHNELLAQLAELFASGAQAHGARLVGHASICLP